MKKILMTLLGIAATIQVMAVDYTAKAVVRLEGTSGYFCDLTLRQADSYGVLNGSEMNMEDRHVALYALNGTTPLQIAKATNMENVHVGLKTDVSTEYSLTVSSVAGTETLYLWDADSVSYALTEGAVYHFTATANSTDEARFVIKKTPIEIVPSLCFEYNILEIIGYEGQELILTKDEVVIDHITSLDASYIKDLNAYTGRMEFTLNGNSYAIDANPEVTLVNP